MKILSFTVICLLVASVSCNRSSLDNQQASARSSQSLESGGSGASGKESSGSESDKSKKKRKSSRDRLNLDEVPTEQVAPELDLSQEEWKKRLSSREFYILREDGTERAHTGDLLDNKTEGQYVCAGCGELLFSSEHKFESGTGWPSFYEMPEGTHIGRVTDSSMGMTRVEVYCKHCGGHQGHVFPDGPKPTGLRYCINSASMKFEPKDMDGDGEIRKLSAWKKKQAATQK